VVFRGEGLSDRIEETDPQKVDHKPKEPAPLSPEAERTSAIVRQFIDSATRLLREREPANFVLLRGFAKNPEIPSLSSLYKMKTAAIATYPMYRGLAKLVGMDLLKTGETVPDEFECLRTHYADYDFFYLHVKPTDKAGEDGDCDRKREAIEEVDENLTTIQELKPDCLVVTSDHSTPCTLASHSWHPNPVMLVSEFGGVDEVTAFTERECAKGGLGRMPAEALMGLMLANTLRLKKFGA
jgi:2,3-bisphosphoglycerate-independent phosphoglycerate mutase